MSSAAHRQFAAASIAAWGAPPLALLPEPILLYYKKLSTTEASFVRPPEDLPVVAPTSLDATCWELVPNALAQAKQLEELAVFYARAAIDSVAGHALCPRLATCETPIKDRLWLRNRSLNVCARAGFETIGDLAKVTYGHLRALPTCGTLTILDIACALEAVGDIGDPPEESPNVAPPSPRETAAQQLIERVAGSKEASPVRAQLLLIAAAKVQSWEPRLRDELQELGQALTPAELVADMTNGPTPHALAASLLDSFKERPRAVFAGRFLPRANRPTLEELGTRFGITRERIRQIETKVERQLQRILASEALRPLIRCAAAVRLLLGAAIPVSALEARLEGICAGAYKFAPGSDIPVADILLWLAGPFSEKRGWLVADPEHFGTTKAALLNRSETHGFVDEGFAEDLLARFGIGREWTAKWIGALECMKPVAGGWVAAHGSLVNQCISWIRYKNQPVNIEELARITGTESERSLRARLLEDARVKRINKQSDFALADWSQFDKYTGIAEEIAQEIEACGGAASVEHLVAKIAPLYGVKPSSVRQYASAPMFFQGTDRMVRIRGDGERLIVEADPSDNTGCYFVDDAWLFRFEVNGETLRGSGRPIPNGYAVALGCQPGTRHSILTQFGDVTVSWPNTTAAGPNIGSLRHIADACELAPGDWIFFGREAAGGIVKTLRKEVLSLETDPITQALLLMGFGDSAAILAKRTDVWEEIISALGNADAARNSTANDARRFLHARGETLLERYIEPAAEESRDEALNRIVDLLG